MISTFHKFVNDLSKEDLVDLYNECIIRLYELQPQVIIESKDVRAWKTNRYEALLSLRKKYPSYGLSYLRDCLTEAEKNTNEIKSS